METRTQTLPAKNNRPRSAATVADVLAPTPTIRSLEAMNPVIAPNLKSTARQSLQSQNPSQSISVRAYQLWENDGRPDGKDQEYWFRAEAEMNGDMP